VAGKATQDFRFRVEGAIERSGSIGTNFLMAWRDVKRLRRRIEALPMLDVGILVDVSDEGDRLIAGSKGPVRLYRPSPVVPSQSQSVRTLRLQLEFPGMTPAAYLRPYVFVHGPGCVTVDKAGN
jgi:hypothetical protein